MTHILVESVVISCPTVAVSCVHGYITFEVYCFQRNLRVLDLAAATAGALRL